MNVLTSDFETTTHSNGSPFDQRNKAVCVAYSSECQNWGHRPAVCTFELQDTKFFEGGVGNWDLYVFFNAKFDLHWYRKIGVDISNWKVWDCQIAEFIIRGQTNPYPSLDNTAAAWGLGSKLDVVKVNFWNRGVQTDEIPRDILSEYCCLDVDLTYQVYLKQQEYLEDKPLMKRLISLACQDLLVLEEMEWNGLNYDKELCETRSQGLDRNLAELNESLASVYPGVSINFNSGAQLSAFLYGGTIFEDGKEHVGFFKTGAKAGQPKFKNITIEHKLPRLVEPLKNSETKKEGVWKTDEQTLRKLKGPAAKKFVGPLLEMAKLEKLNGTYYKGMPEKAKECCWPEGKLHGNFNQCRAATGRLSSSEPNLQNMAGEMLDVFVTRF